MCRHYLRLGWFLFAFPFFGLRINNLGKGEARVVNKNKVGNRLLSLGHGLGGLLVLVTHDADGN